MISCTSPVRRISVKSRSQYAPIQQNHGWYDIRIYPLWEIPFLDLRRSNGRTRRFEGRTRRSDGRTHRSAPTGDKRNEIFGEHKGSPLSAVVQWFKTMTTNEYIRGVKQHGWKPFPDRLWQRNYWEHIIRNQQELNQIRGYIRNNPERWEYDQLYESGTPNFGEIKEPVCPYTAEPWMV